MVHGGDSYWFMMEFITIGVVLGLSAGFAPGPLFALVISETLQHGVSAGIRVALAPLFTDLLIIIVALAVLSKLADFHNIVGIISLLGGVVILYMGYGSINVRSPELATSDTAPKSLTKGILANALSPHPYLFWFSVGGSLMSRAMKVSVATLVLFLFCFYFCLMGTKVVLAILVGRSRSFLKGTFYIYTMRLLGVALCILSILLFRDGLKLLGVMK